MGQTFARMGMAYRRLGDTTAALESFDRAIELLERLDRESALDFPARLLLVQTYHHHGWELSVVNRRADRVIAHRKALVQAEKILAENPEVSHRSMLANCCTVLGMTLVPTQPDESEKLFQRATLLLGEPGSNQHYLGTAWLALGELQQNDVTKLTEAEKSLRRAIEVFMPLVAKNPRSWQSRDRLADARVHLGRLLARVGRLDLATTELREAVKLREDQAANFTNVPSYQDELLIARVDYIRILASSGKASEARTNFEKLNPPNKPSAVACAALAWLNADCAEVTLRNPNTALEYATRAVEIAPEFATHWRALGAAHYRSGNYLKAIEALTTSLNRRSGGTGFEQCYLAMAHWKLGNPDTARKWQTEATKWIDQRAANDPELARLLLEVSVIFKEVR